MESKKLTTEQKSKIEQVKNWYAVELEKINKRREYRANNYYNCVDDYSYGGICDKADDQIERSIELERDLRIEEIENGKIVRAHSYWTLQDLDGNTVSTVPRTNHLFGAYFALDGTFVHIPKRMSTLEKKGYRMAKHTVTFELMFGGFMRNGRVRWKSIKRIAETSCYDCNYDNGEQTSYEHIEWQENYLKKKKRNETNLKK